MIRFVLGIIVGIAIGGGGMYLWNHRGRVLRDAPNKLGQDAGPAPKKAPRRHGSGGSVPASAPTDSTITLADADLRIVAEGDPLRAANKLDMSEGDARDLAQDEIDGAFARRSGAIIKCITDARGAAPVMGRVSCGVVVGADGSVSRTRVEGPAWLLHHGLAGCVRPLLKELKFPAAGKETVVTVPFDLHE